MLWLLIPFAFLLGSIPFGFILGKFRGLDIRDHGSGNIGATNVYRVVSKKSGVFCFFLDFCKGFIPVLVADHFVGPGTTGQVIEVCAALAAILGHNYSPWVGFKGGKGIATSAGALAGLMPVALVLLLTIFTVTTFVSRYVSVGSIVTAVALPVLTIFGSYYHGKIADGTWNIPLFVFSLIAGLLAVWKHRSNISRLLAGTENKIGSKKKSSQKPLS